MLQELMSIFRQGNPLKTMADDFSRMLDLAYKMTLAAGEAYFGHNATPEERTRIYKMDVKVNKLERSLRKAVVVHLSVGANRHSLPYTLVLMSLVKDVERLGDYAKNLAEIDDIYSGPLPEDDLGKELRELRTIVEESLRAAPDVLVNSDREQALTLIQEGKDVARRSDLLLTKISKSEYPNDLTVAMVLGSRYYKRIGGHLLNLLSSVVMPLHKIDYYDEDEIPSS
jgi:phosphate uptake regulator